MIRSRHTYSTLTSLLSLACVVANAVGAGRNDLYHWHCPYSPDGVCTPNRNNYGYYQTKWSRWPGVTDADYESRSPAAAAPTGPSETGPRMTPGDILPPARDTLGDMAPPPPGGGDAAPQPLTPPNELRPDILTPPGEDIMDELLEEGDKLEKSEPKPLTEQERSSETAPKTTPKTKPETKPETTPETDEPFDDNPFKDEPLFNEEETPGSPSGTKRSGVDGGAGPVLPVMPAHRATPNGSPTARLGRGSASAQAAHASLNSAKHMANPVRSRRAAGGDSAGENNSVRNPLRSNMAAEMVVVDEMVRPTEWHEPAAAEPEFESGELFNPLRAQ